MRPSIAACTGAIVIAAGTIAGVAAQSARPPVPLTLNQWATLYERDPLDASIRLGAMTDKEAWRLRDTIMGAAKGWPKGAPPLRDPLLTIATLALELEYARVNENDWREIPGHNSGMYAVARAAEVIERRATADAAAHAWWRVALTLGEANHDNYSMLKPRFMTHPPVRFDFLPRALNMFPGDIGFRFSEARMHARSVAPILELESPREGIAQPQPGVFAFGMGFLGAPSKRQTEQLDDARLLLAPLTSDPAVGAGARFWSGYLQWVTGDITGARNTIDVVAAAGDADRDTRYTAAVMLGYMDEALGHVSDAASDFEAALGVRPKSQTASFALAALRYRDGRAEDAERLVHDSLGPRDSDDDPWRLLLYGDLRMLPEQIDALRHAVSGGAK